MRHYYGLGTLNKYICDEENTIINTQRVTFEDVESYAGIGLYTDKGDWIVHYMQKWWYVSTDDDSVTLFSPNAEHPTDCVLQIIPDKVWDIVETHLNSDRT